MRALILKAVANPPKILWGPLLSVLINLSIQFPLMFMAIGAFNMNPIFFLASITLVHTGIVLYGTKEPHISTMIQAFGQTYHKTNNLYPEGGNKFEP